MSSCLNQTKINQPSDFSACLPTAQKVKIESTTEQPIQLFEVQVMSPVINYNILPPDPATDGKTDTSLKLKQKSRMEIPNYFEPKLPQDKLAFWELNVRDGKINCQIHAHPTRILSSNDEIKSIKSDKEQYVIHIHGLVRYQYSCIPIEIQLST